MQEQQQFTKIESERKIKSDAVDGLAERRPRPKPTADVSSRLTHSLTFSCPLSFLPLVGTFVADECARQPASQPETVRQHVNHIWNALEVRFEVNPRRKAKCVTLPTELVHGCCVFWRRMELCLVSQPSKSPSSLSHCRRLLAPACKSAVSA